MIEYLSFFLECTTTTVLGAAAYYLYSLIKMAEEIINELLPEVSHNPSKAEVEWHTLIRGVLSGNSKQYLGKAYTKEQVNELSVEEVDTLFNIYEGKLFIPNGKLSW